MSELKINQKYKINPGTINRINKLKEFIGEEKFDQILQGVALVDIPLDEKKYVELMQICLADNPEDIDVKDIPYSDAEEILSFFCSPFAGKYLKQTKYMMDGVYSLLRDLPEEKIRTMMESLISLKPSGSSTDASSSPEETSKEASDSMNLQHPQDTPDS